MAAPIGRWRRLRPRHRRLKTAGVENEGATGARKERRRGSRASVASVLVKIGTGDLEKVEVGRIWTKPRVND